MEKNDQFAIGFVGNEIELNAAQNDNLVKLLSDLAYDEIHHTNASGVERECHYLFWGSTEAKIVVHEPEIYRGRTKENERVTVKQCTSDFLATLNMLEHINLLIVAPIDMTRYSMKQMLTGIPKGRMAVYSNSPCRTLRYVPIAGKCKKPMIILREDGQVIRFN
jgi:hypothetical protein